MVIANPAAPARNVIKRDWLAPMASAQVAAFTTAPGGGASTVTITITFTITWAMSGPMLLVSQPTASLVSMDF